MAASSEPPMAPPRRRALVVLSINGNHGSPNDFNNFAAGLKQQFQSLICNHFLSSHNSKAQHAHSDKRHNPARGTRTISHIVPAGNGACDILFHLQSSTSTGLGTHHGIEIMAGRAAKEVVEWMRDEVLPYLTAIEGSTETTMPYGVYLTVVGHSLGGLIARYLIKLLLDPSPNNTSTSLLPLFASHPNITLRPLTFMTICTPHFGSRRSAKPGSFIAPIFQSAVSFYLKYAAGQTGKELYLIDGNGDWNGELGEDREWVEDRTIPLLMRMSEPRSSYIAALKQFNPILISALRDDIPVGYCSAAVASVHPHPELLGSGGEVGQVVQEGLKDAGLRIVSYSGFSQTEANGEEGGILANDYDTGDIGRRFWLENLFSPKDGMIDAAEELKGIICSNVIEICNPKGTSHHIGEAFHSIPQAPPTTTPNLFSTLRSLLPAARQPSAPPIPFVSDAHHDNLIPISLLKALQQTLTSSTRRINLDFHLSNPVTRATTHALAVGKPEGGALIGESVKVAKMAGWLLARIVVLDYLAALKGITAELQ